MKKILILFAAALAALSFASCEKSEAPGSDCVMTVRIANASDTKAVGTVPGSAVYQSAKEQTITNLQVLVFNSGNLDGYASSTSGAASIDVSCTAGSRKVYVIANGPNASAITTESACQALVSTLVEDDDNFCMVGTATHTISNGGTYPVTINRLAAKIVVRKVSNKITNATLAALPFSVERIYITNVAKTFNVGMDTYASAVADYANRGGYQASNNLGSFTQDLGIGATVANGASYTADHYFYAYPNNKDQQNYAATWTPKRTMLVIQVRIGTQLYDYPITFPVLESNKMYVLDEVEITKPGNLDNGAEGGEDEENPITSGSCTFNVTVNDWTLVVVPKVTI